MSLVLSTSTRKHGNVTDADDEDTTRISITVSESTLKKWDKHYKNLDEFEDRSTFIRACVTRTINRSDDDTEQNTQTTGTPSDVDLSGLENDVAELRREIESLTEKTRKQNAMEAAYPGREQAKQNIIRILPEAEDPVREDAEKYDDLDVYSYQHLDPDAIDGELMPFEVIHDTVFENLPKQHALDLLNELVDEVDAVKSVARGQIDPDEQPDSMMYYMEK